MNTKRILLTGGTGGLGHDVTSAILAHYSEVTMAIPYQDENRVRRIKERLPATHFEKLRFVKTNLAQEASVEQLVNDIGRVDILIHLVGGFSMGNIHEFSYQKWQSSLDLNLNTTFLVCKHTLPQMRSQKYGRIVNIASRAAVEPAAGLAAYSAAKAGVVALTQAIAKENKDFNITANVILPSVIDTPSNREAMGDAQAHTWVKPESIAQTILFLISDAASDISGALIPVYGKI
jgi:NAD(P)-dependent dehydrogenase (short-subunit alcohol dehydrogenase family)